MPLPPPLTLPLPLPALPPAKRVVDLAGALTLLALLAPVLAVAAAALAATGHGRVFVRASGRTSGRTSGRVFVRQECAGLAGAAFRTWRFATTGRTGALLERCALDGLPQLLNVVRGEMSLVGPRPQAGPGGPDAGRAPVPPPERLPVRLLVRPGVTGLWQVSARSELPWEEMALLDRHYVEHHWLGMDLAILARTPRAALAHRARAGAA
ncbi:sugar transferase [Streptomyces sp. NPDC090022]|uniref:sugar transferase n=1 Tax=Streptomyces sp. NPDC090022 TaxID=3365920 RepID=UPI00381399D3